MAGVVREGAEMVAGMNPVLDPVPYVFCTDARDGARDWSEVFPRALALFREDEGISLVLPLDEARGFDLPCDMPMRRITLGVFSALDGVGLTAAVAGALAARGIACNVIAAFHHDHVFVPQADADAAMAALRQCQGRTADDQ